MSWIHGIAGRRQVVHSYLIPFSVAPFTAAAVIAGFIVNFGSPLPSKTRLPPRQRRNRRIKGLAGK